MLVHSGLYYDGFCEHYCHEDNSRGHDNRPESACIFDGRDNARIGWQTGWGLLDEKSQGWHHCLWPNSWKDGSAIKLWEILTEAVATGVMGGQICEFISAELGWIMGFQVDMLSRQFGYVKMTTVWVVKLCCSTACVLLSSPRHWVKNLAHS